MYVELSKTNESYKSCISFANDMACIMLCNIDDLYDNVAGFSQDAPENVVFRKLLCFQQNLDTSYLLTFETTRSTKE